MDYFYEQLLPAQKASSYKKYDALAYIFCILAVISLVMGSLVFYLEYKIATICLLISCLVCVVISVISFRDKKKLFVEYEYEFTNGIINIDAIYEMKNRKKMRSFEAKDIELMAPAHSNYVKEFSNIPQKTESYYTDVCKEKLYNAIITAENERIQLLFTPDDRFVELCFKYNPKAVKKTK